MNKRMRFNGCGARESPYMFYPRWNPSVSALAVSVDERVRFDEFGAGDSLLPHVHLSITCHPFREESKRKRLDLVLVLSVDKRVRFDEFGVENPR
jgi:hypothetical protein